MLEIIVQVSAVIVSVVILAMCTWSCRRKRGYASIPDEENVSEKLTRDRQFQRLALKEALCQFFLNLSGKYSFVDQLDDIGCRLGRSWFIVKEKKGEKMLLVLTKKSSDCCLTLTNTTIQLLRDLFEPLARHPYIYPVTDIGVLSQKPFVFVVEPFSKKGTLKDLIHKKRPRDVWAGKYRVQGKALNVLEIKTYGRQILKAMLFLHSKGIPTNGHVHSGNIFVKKCVCRISGYEQAILGFKSRLYPRLSRALKKNKYAIDSLCFGHLLYEMAYGQELFDAKPGKLHYEFCSRSVEVGEILKYIFGTDDSSYPDVKDILHHRFFQGADGLDPIDPDSIFFKPQVTRNVLKPFKKYFKKMRRKSGKDRSEVGMEEEESPDIWKRSREEDHNFLVSYEAETETISNPILSKQTHASSTHVPSSPTYISSSPQRTPPIETRRPHIPAEKQDDKARNEPRDEPARPLFGVEALMDSIKQAIQQRHDAFDHSDEMSSRRSSFSSASPPNSPMPLDIPQPQSKQPSNTSKPSLPNKPALAANTDQVPPPPACPESTPACPQSRAQACPQNTPYKNEGKLG
ncbi:slowpoke-binding protein-like [Dendronephthya gigantea]|uniref:slowpoke-binding protein-like n=1 Tax=Dendronephthya gigantea TaxID=151771 RepID=UPI00106937B3|nr:slowpoke-binding protein-like [Dendronephthya gigantea]